jgi:hypothetical protein
MDTRILAAHGEVHIVTDTAGIMIQVAGRTIYRSWVEITGAGMAFSPGAEITLPMDSIELPGGNRVPFEIVPLGGKLIALNRELAATHRALIIGDGGPGFQVFLPSSDPGTQSLVAELRNRLGSRWQSETTDLNTLRKELGLRTSWAGRLLGLVFVVVVAVGGFLAMAAWAGIKAAWEDGDFSLLQPVTLGALTLWAVGVWYLVRRLGHRHR